MAPRLHQLYRMTSDLDRSERFYTEVLGLDVSERGARSVEFDAGACALKLEADFDEATLAAFGLFPPGDERGNGSIAVVEVDDVDAVHERASKHATGEVLAEPRDVDWGRRLCLVADPDGYVVEVSRPLESE